jgi:hypothetical protein
LALVPMVLSMSETAVTPSLPDTGGEPEFRPSARERLGVAVFLFAAVAATATWIGALVWGVVKLVGQF